MTLTCFGLLPLFFVPHMYVRSHVEYSKPSSCGGTEFYHDILRVHGCFVRYGGRRAVCPVPRHFNTVPWEEHHLAGLLNMVILSTSTHGSHDEFRECTESDASLSDTSAASQFLCTTQYNSFNTASPQQTPSHLPTMHIE